jgi:pimeloyl-ACP methyl ester carboxylesterase
MKQGSAPVYSTIAGVVIGALAVAAFVNHQAAKAAERRNPPVGRFMDIDGVRLHYFEKGMGDPLVLLHGNGSMIDDFGTSGLIDLAAKTYRVIAIDRPGYGHSSRPRDRAWTADAQADLVHAALLRLGVTRATVLGHSWGALVALALASRHPTSVNALVLASGYYFPTARADVPLLSIPAVPIVGDVVRFTLAPIVSRLIWPLLMRKMFGPAPVPPKFEDFLKEMALRPSQLRASAAESALMIPTAAEKRRVYSALTMPVAIVAGEADRVVDTNAQAVRLDQAITGSSLYILPGVGHMVHQTDPRAVMAAIEEVAGEHPPRVRSRAGGGPGAVSVPPGAAAFGSL